MAPNIRSCPVCNRALAEGEFCSCAMNESAPQFDAAMTSGGAVENRFGNLGARAPAGPPQEAPLELDEAAVKHAFAPPPPPEPVKRPRRRVAFPIGKVLALAVIVGLAVAGWLQRTWLTKRLDELPVAMRAASAKPMLLVESVPPGAEVYLGDTLLGNTPFAGDNDFPEGKYTLKVVLKGFRPFTATIEGGRGEKLRAVLQKK